MIGEDIFKIKYDKNSLGASFCFADTKRKYGNITIGIASKNKIHTLNLLIHELKEIIQVQQHARFSNDLNASYEFHYNHAQHQELCERLAGVLTFFLK